MYGEDVPVAAEVINLRQFSAHAGKSELMRWLTGLPAPPRQTYLVHGEPAASACAQVRDRINFSLAGVAARVPADRRSGWLALRHSRLRRSAREVLESLHPPRTGGFMQLHHATGVLLILIANALPGMGQGRPTPSRNTYGIAGTVRDDYDQHTMENVRVT